MDNADLERLKTEIKDFHERLKQAHFNKDLDFFVENIDESYFSVSRGEIRHPDRKQILSNFTNYLERTTFKEYRDIQEPLIGISRDGSLAWSLVRVKVSGEQTGPDGSAEDLDFICAWITLFERREDTWIRLGEVSSFD